MHLVQIARAACRNERGTRGRPSQRGAEAWAAPREIGVSREVRRLVRSSPRLADLAIVFPGLLHAIGRRHGSAAARLDVLALIERARC